MKLRYAPPFILAAALTLTGCASSGSSSSFTPVTQTFTSDAGSPSSAAGQPSAAAGSPTAVPCTTRSCIASDAQQSMVGTSAEDGSVVTKARCFKSTVKANPGDTYTVSCDITYTDGQVWAGLVTLLLASNQVSWQPQTELS